MLVAAENAFSNPTDAFLARLLIKNLFMLVLRRPCQRHSHLGDANPPPHRPQSSAGTVGKELRDETGDDGGVTTRLARGHGQPGATWHFRGSHGLTPQHKRQDGALKLGAIVDVEREQTCRPAAARAT